MLGGGPQPLLPSAATPLATRGRMEGGTTGERVGLWLIHWSSLVHQCRLSVISRFSVPSKFSFASPAAR
jgi:hypothetical protein